MFRDYNYNNYKTSIVPISSKRIEVSGAPSTGVGQIHSLGTMQGSSTIIRWKGNLGRISESEKVSFQMVTESQYEFILLTLGTDYNYK